MKKCLKKVKNGEKRIKMVVLKRLFFLDQYFSKIPSVNYNKFLPKMGKIKFFKKSHESLPESGGAFCVVLKHFGIRLFYGNFKEISQPAW